MSELSKPEEDFQDPGEAQGLVTAQLLGAEAGVAASASASSPTVSSLGGGESLPHQALNEMIASLMKFLLLKYRAKEPTSQAEMLKKVLRDNQEYFPVVFSQASQCLQLVFGVEVKEVDPREHIYIMVSILGLSCNAMLSSGQSIPKAGLLVLVLNLIMRNGDRAPEEKEGYLEYRQVPYSHPARYEFLWGPRAYAETSKDLILSPGRSRDAPSVDPRRDPHIKAQGTQRVDEHMLHFLTSRSQRNWGPGKGGVASGPAGTRRGRQRTEACALRSEGREGAGSTQSQGITLVVEMSELSKPEEDFQDPGEAQGLVTAQLLGAEAGVAASASASSPTVSSLGGGESLPHQALNEMIASLMKFLLLKYRAKEPTSQAEMLKKVLRDNQEYFPVVFSQALQCLQLVFGVEVKEVDPREHIYIMVSILGLSCNAMLSSGQSIPKAGLLVLVLNLIMRNGDRAPEEKDPVAPPRGDHASLVSPVTKGIFMALFLFAILFIFYVILWYICQDLNNDPF
ncbi:hypothetical protein MJG53_019860 [Ovis ammon polii x Ovis aries]|uniref:Uncharacterized protein n=1 Tax=Ovis ammon polii x Ovis aries TaxID=2918886 RepID=A0ACB9U127_9CETA|nr:hypothetical protein MJG53_019860 [Ovis ammon polii x Ovis aries]